VLSGRGLCDELITRPKECGVSECERESWTMRKPWPVGGLLQYAEKIESIPDLTLKTLN